MNLEKLVLGTALAISSLACTTYKIIKRPPKPVPIPLTQNTAEEIQLPKAQKNYRQIRYASGTYSLYDTTFFTPESKLKEEEKSKEIEERISYISETIERTGILENSKRELDKDKLSSKTLPINLPKDKKAAINTLEECLNVKETTNINFYRALCSVSPAARGSTLKTSGYGIIIGDNYVLTSASIVYSAIAVKEIQQNKSENELEDYLAKLEKLVEINVLEEMKEREEGRVNYAKILAINPLNDLAILEITDSDKARNWRIPTLKNNKIQNVTLYTDSTLNFLESDANLKENELAWRFNSKELKTAEALSFSLTTIKTPLNLIGTGIYNSKGLVGLIAGRPEDFKKESINTLAINGDLIRNFLIDYINFLRSGSDNLENLTKIVPKETRIPEETKTPSLESKIENEHRESQEVPRKDITNYIFIGYLSLVATAVGKFFYDIYSAKEKKPEEEFKPEENIQARLNELKCWINAQKEIKSKEAIETLQTDRIIPPTSENLKSQSTIDGLDLPDDVLLFPKKFLEYMDEKTDFPKQFKIYMKGVVERAKEVEDETQLESLLQKIKKLDEERSKRIQELNAERRKRLIKILNFKI